MLDFESVVQGEIPAVNPLDLQRFWTFQWQHPKEPGVSVGFTREAILQACRSPLADPIAVLARTILLNILLEQGQLENWLEAGRPNTAVFETTAVFALPSGLQQFDPAEFLAQLAAL